MYSSWASSTCRRASWVRARAGEDVEDQLAAVEHLALGDLLDVADLRRGEVVLEDDGLGPVGLDHLGELLDLALAEERLDRRLHPLLHELVDHHGPGGLGQAAQFVERVVRVHRRVGKQRRGEDGLFLTDLKFFALAGLH